jgi:hypothetical protein
MNNVCYDEMQHVMCPAHIDLPASELSPAHPYQDFTLGLSEKEQKMLQQLRTNNADNLSEYNNWGSLHTLQSELVDFINSLSTDNAAIALPIATTIHRLVTEIIESSEQGETAVVGIVPYLNKPTGSAWHTDSCPNNTFTRDKQETCLANEHLVVFTLKGPSTKFINLPVEQEDEFRAPQRSSTLSPSTMAMLDNSTMIYSAQFGHGSIFLLGDSHGAIHQAPSAHGERLFIEVYPCSASTARQVKAWM